MVKTLIRNKARVKQKQEAAPVRSYQSEEFEADTTEERPIALLAERRRQFLAQLLAQLQVRQNNDDALSGK